MLDCSLCRCPGRVAAEKPQLEGVHILAARVAGLPNQSPSVCDETLNLQAKGACKTAVEVSSATGNVCLFPCDGVVLWWYGVPATDSATLNLQIRRCPFLADLKHGRRRRYSQGSPALDRSLDARRDRKGKGGGETVVSGVRPKTNDVLCLASTCCGRNRGRVAEALITVCGGGW